MADQSFKRFEELEHLQQTTLDEYYQIGADLARDMQVTHYDEIQARKAFVESGESLKGHIGRLKLQGFLDGWLDFCMEQENDPNSHTKLNQTTE